METAEKQLLDAEAQLRSKQETARALEDQLSSLKRETDNTIDIKDKRIEDLTQALKVIIDISLHFCTMYMYIYIFNQQRKVLLI